MPRHGTIRSSSKRRRSLLLPRRHNDAQPSFPILTEDLTTENLSTLPVKSLLRFRCVCKSWKTLISSSAFVKYHLHRSITDPSLSRHQLLVRNGWDGDSFRSSLSLQTLLENPLTSPPPPLQPASSISTNFQPCPLVVGSCNGLVCWVYIFDIYNQYFHYLNPSTRVQAISPWFPYFLESATMFGFGYDDSNDSYKTVGIYCEYGFEALEKIVNRITVMVYTLGSVDASWREIKSFPFVPVASTPGKLYAKVANETLGVIHSLQTSGKFVNGTLNWLCARNDDNHSLMVLSIDIVKETCGEVSLPHVIPHAIYVEYGSDLCVLGGCLCFCNGFVQKRFVLWQMKVYGVTESWTLLLNISYSDIGIDIGFGYYEHIFVYPIPFYMLENGEVMIKIHDRVLLYDPQHASFTYLKFQSNMMQFDGITHIESLVSPRPTHS